METLATIEAFNDRIPGGVGSADSGRAYAMLEDASALIRAEAGKTWTDDVPPVAVPDVVKTVCMSAAKRAFLNPDGVNSMSLDGNAATFATGSPDVYLTKAEKSAVHKAAGRSGLWSLSTTRTEGTATDGTGPADTPSPSPDAFEDPDPHITDIWPT